MAFDTNSRQQETTQAMRRSSGSFELAFAPVILAGIGFLVDRAVGTSWIFALAFFVFGFLGAGASLYYRYKAEMSELSQDAVWAKHQSSAEFRAKARARALRLSLPRERSSADGVGS